MKKTPISRRSFLAASAVVPLAVHAAPSSKIPVGLELYSVRDQLNKDLMATVRAVAKMGYQVVEFYSPYYDWTEAYTKQVRALLDDLGIHCYSTHNNASVFSAESLQQAIDRNKILGTRFIVMASAGRVTSLDGWKEVADRLSQASAKLKTVDLRAGYHNHQTEFTVLDGKRPIEIIAANTPKELMLQLDVGTCIEVGSDPVAWIRANPGRINCLHCKDWAPGEGKGYEVLFGEGVAPWANIFAAAESVGGVEYYLIEQEGSRFGSLEAVQRCLAAWKQMRS
jgi:sugar phosphate isomerase/epimerase